MNHHGWEHHHHGQHHHPMHDMHWGRPFGLMLLPLFALFVGFFMLMLLFKTGLWIPLLLIGAFFLFIRPAMTGRRAWGGKSSEEWGAFRKNMREKLKNEWSSWHGEASDVIAPDKPKHDTTEYV